MKKILIVFFVLAIHLLNAQVACTFSEVKCKPVKLVKVYQFNPGRLPAFNGGPNKMQEYILAQLVLEKKEQKKVIDKPIKIAFDVDSIGTVCNVRLINNSGAGEKIEKDIVNVFCGMPAWIPGGTASTETEPAVNVCIRMMMEISFNEKGQTRYDPSVRLLPIPRGTISKQIPGDQEPVTFAEQMPDFRGGFAQYLSQTVKYPVAEKEAGRQGTVYISFVVEKDGRITNVDIAKDIPLAPGLTTESMRVIAAMPKWEPGKNNGKPVRVKMIQPVRFVLQ